MSCPHCRQKERQNKQGKTKVGSQKYLCRDCKRVYTPKAKRREYSEEIKKQTIKLYLEENSGLAVSRILGISKNMCLYWVKKYAKKIKPKKVFNERVEVYSFIERKNRIYVMTLVSRDKRQTVGYDIAFDKSRERIQKLVDNSPKAKHYYSDAYSAYCEICYYSTHTALKNESQTYMAEGANSDLRRYIPALQRRSKCFFRSLETMKAVFNIFVHAFNNFADHKIKFPSLKKSFSIRCKIPLGNPLD